MLAAYATHPDRSRGRLVPEPESATRTPFQRDRDRIVHSGAFRKLQHKTQVFVFHVGDYYRTRLTHSLEVAQIARSISRSLDLDEDLAEAIALAHDLGHTPFGHAGERALDAEMAAYGGFQHNDQTIRILTTLEQRYADFDGLNLTWECMEGVAKHNGPLTDAVSPTLAELNEIWGLELGAHPGAEAQVAALADDIAYNNHDIDDGLRAGLFTVDDLAEVPFVAAIFAEVQSKYPDLHRRRLVHESIRRLINQMVSDVIVETQSRLSALNPRNVEEIRLADQPMVAFSSRMAENNQQLRSFLMRRMYRHYQVNRETAKAARLVGTLFRLFNERPDTLPTDWQEAALDTDEGGRARVVADYIAGMTDRYALLEHQRLFDPQDRH
ncbi:MAG: deoxyguanosinetriphosphate triphosphohydrolase [Pseudomonadota bacterium]